MSLPVHEPRHVCDCAAHRPVTATMGNTGLWSTLLPILACALCPACLTTYAKLFSVVGLGFGLSEFQHLVLLATGLVVSVGVSAWRSWQTRRGWPVGLALAGSALVAAGHFGGDLGMVEGAGVLLLLVGGVTEHVRLRAMGASPLAWPKESSPHHGWGLRSPLRPLPRRR